ncbi:hypothetical protein FQN57_000818 [Myotisia sp. PD_48]|nr:hypothetical protein FQN57_000818 [Myotisia sp. PD_48]
MSVDFGSGDHRGTPDEPGRVVTVIQRSFWETLSDPQKDLEPDSGESLVWGAAYRIPSSHAEEVNAYLDDREIDGYSVHYTPFHTCPTFKSSSINNSLHLSSSEPIKCMVYIGLPSNTQFLREPSLRDPSSIAQVISVSRGQSGENKEYLYLLEKALENLGLGSADAHITSLVRRVMEIEKNNKKGDSNS